MKHRVLEDANCRRPAHVVAVLVILQTFEFQKLKIVYQPGAGNVVTGALSRCPVHEGATGKNMAKGQADQLGSQQIEFDVAKDLVFALREVELETEALQGAYYKGLTPVTEDQQVPLWNLRVGGHGWKEALAECEEFGGAYKQAKETSGQVTRAEVKGALRDSKGDVHLVFIKLQGLSRICVPSDRIFRQHMMYQMHDNPTAGHMGVRKTYDVLACQFYRSGIRPYALTYVESCPRCRAAKHVSVKRRGFIRVAANTEQKMRASFDGLHHWNADDEGTA